MESRSTPSAITPILYDETLIVSSQAMGVTALRPTKTRRQVGRRRSCGRPRDVSLFLSNPVIVGDTLFGLSEKARGQFFALDAKSGNVLWLGQPRQASNTAIVKAGSLLLLLNDDGELIVARSSRNGFEAAETVHCRRQRDLGPAGRLGQSSLRQRSSRRSRCGR